MTAQKTKGVGLGVVILGLLFFFNPYFSVIDVLPDFLGCIIVYLGLSRLALLHPTMQEARNGFLKLAAIDIAKNLALVVIFSMGATAEQPIALLVAAFVAAVLELMFLIPTFRSLFDGFYSLASHYDCKELYGNVNDGISRTDAMYHTTCFFLIFREVVCLLPEVTSLTTSTYSDSSLHHIYEYIGIMRLLAFALVLGVGIYWLVSLLIYYRRWRRQEQALADLGDRYSVYYTTHPGITVKRRQGTALVLMLLGVILLTDFYLDFQNILPDVIAGVLIAVGAMIPAVPPVYRICTASAALAYGAVAFFSDRSSYRFSTEYSIGELGKNVAADRAYQSMWILSLAEFLVFLVLLVALLLLLRSLIRKWAGYRAQHTQNEFEERCKTDLFADFDRQLMICSVFGFVGGLFSFLYDYIKVVPGGRGISHLLEFTWMFDFCASLAFAVALGILFGRIYAEIKNRYRYD